MAYDRDINVIIGAEAGGFAQALQSTQQELKRFVSQVEKETNTAWDTVQRRVARSVGSSLASQRSGYVRDMKAMWQRDMYPTAPGMGQGEMVGPRTMSRSEAATALTRDSSSILQSWEKIGKLVMLTKTGIDLTKMATAAWAGRMKEVHEYAQKLPPIIRESAQAGLAAGEPLADWWTKQWFAGTGALGGKRSRQMGSETVEVTQQIEADRLKARVDAQREATILLMATEDERAMIELNAAHKARMADAQSDEERKAILERYNAERLIMIRRQTDKENAEADRRNTEQEKRRAEGARRARAKEDELLATFRAQDKERRAKEQEAAAAAAAAAPGDIRARGVGAISARFLTRMPGQAVNVSDAWSKNEKKLEQMKTEAKKTNTLLARLIQVNERPNGGRALVYAG